MLQYRRAHIRGAVNIPAGTAKQDRRAAAGPPDRAVLLSWTEQHAGREVAGSLGYETADVYGGIQAYRGRYLDWEWEA